VSFLPVQWVLHCETRDGIFVLITSALAVAGFSLETDAQLLSMFLFIGIVWYPSMDKNSCFGMIPLLCIEGDVS
jgi:hypothetical protein